MGLNTAVSNRPSLGKRGFVTIATGKQKYYDLAQNLLHSYRMNGNSDVPFAILCDRDCPVAREFDDIVLLPDPHCSYLDKLYLYQYIPYEETIFIDADALILGDTNVLWKDFEEMGDFSCYGRKLPLDSRDGWFFYEDMGSLQSEIPFCISMHGGLYYLRKTEQCQKLFSRAVEFAQNYQQYTFAYFQKPADEPVLALSMVLAGLEPCPHQTRIIFLPSHEGKISVTRAGAVRVKGMDESPVILHFGNRNLPRFIYQYLLALINLRHRSDAQTLSSCARMKIRFRSLPYDAKVFSKRMIKLFIPERVLDWKRARKTKNQ